MRGSREGVGGGVRTPWKIHFFFLNSHGIKIIEYMPRTSPPLPPLKKKSTPAREYKLHEVLSI